MFGEPREPGFRLGVLAIRVALTGVELLASRRAPALRRLQLRLFPSRLGLDGFPFLLGGDRRGFGAFGDGGVWHDDSAGGKCGGGGVHVSLGGSHPPLVRLLPPLELRVQRIGFGRFGCRLILVRRFGLVLVHRLRLWFRRKDLFLLP